VDARQEAEGDGSRLAVLSAILQPAGIRRTVVGVGGTVQP